MERTFPGLDDRIDPPHKVAVLVGILSEEGITAEQALAGSGISSSAVMDPATRISTRQLLTVFNNALQLSKDPTLALRAGKRINITHFGMYGYALLSSPTPRDAIEFALKYRPLTAPLIGLAFHEKDGVPIWEFSDVLALGTDSPLFRFILEFQLGTQLSLHGDILGDTAIPLEIRVTYPAPGHVASYEQLLGCHVHFGQAVNEVRFNNNWLERKLAYANPITASLVRETCDQLLAELRTASGLASKVSAMLLAQPGRFPDIEALAAQLHMTPRTIRRKLQMQGTSYQKISADVRKQLAIDYLRKTHMSNDDIAAALGFSDAANFRLAFKRWTGKTPSDYRTAMV
jgi:AraC-like DNA-binding protein